MDSTIKPGTRCECRGHRCPGGNKGRHGIDARPCEREAVRMVTVFVRTVPPDPRYPNVPATGRYDHVPMCEPCATYHERSSK